MRLSKKARLLKKNFPPVKCEPVDQAPVDVEHECSKVVDELNERGISYMAIPKVKRDEATVLDQKLTQAANEGRDEDFLRYLKQWRECFH